MELSREVTRILAAARQEAIGLGHSLVGSEHLLLALVSRRGSDAAWLLEERGWTPEAIRRLLQRAGGSGTPGLPLAQGFSPRALAILAGSATEARRLGAAEIQPEHLLLALVRATDSTAARLLAVNGTCLDLVFTDLYEDLLTGVSHRQEAERGVPMRQHAI